VTTPGVVLFDLGGVLLPFTQARRVRAVSEALGLDEAATRAVLRADLFARLDTGEADETEFAAAFSEAAGRPVCRNQAKALILSVFEPPNAELWDIAEGLRSKTTVGGFSDNPAFVREVFPAGGDLDPMFWSSELGATKAGDDAFAMVEARLGLPPADILFIDDSLPNVERARRRGWQAAHFISNAALIADLAARGLT
jgi:HAD superfamily hydrolase (TIGR01509 family)